MEGNERKIYPQKGNKRKAYQLVVTFCHLKRKEWKQQSVLRPTHVMTDSRFIKWSRWILSKSIRHEILLFIVTFVIHFVSLILRRSHPVKSRVTTLSKGISARRHLLSHLAILEEDEYDIPFYCQDGGISTLMEYSFCHSISRKLPYTRQIITSDDGGSLAIDWLSLGSSFLSPDAPIFLFIQGFGYHEEIFHRRLTPCLSRKTRVISISCRGCGGVGMSSSLEDAIKFVTDDVARAIREVRSLYPEARIHVSGFGLGGTLAILYAIKYSGREEGGWVDSLLTVCSPTSSRDIFPERRTDPISSSLEQVISRHYKAFLGRNDVAIPDTLDGTKHLLDGIRFQLKRLLLNSCQSDLEMGSTEWLPFQDIEIPTIFLIAEDDPVVSIDDQRLDKIIQANGRITIVKVQHGGHMSFLETSRRSNRKKRPSQKHPIIPDSWFVRFFLQYAQHLIHGTEYQSDMKWSSKKVKKSLKSKVFKKRR